MTETKPIDWKLALKTVAYDVEFLKEVLDDLKSEASTAEADIAEGISKSDCLKIKSAAHKVKGSASYLDCHPLKDIAFMLQETGQKGYGTSDRPAPREDTVAALETSKQQFPIFQNEVRRLLEDIDSQDWEKLQAEAEQLAASDN